jgi:hypothetical protein
MTTKYIFSGHESFECRQFWLKKGYDHVSNKEKFDDAAVISLGVGRNMVTSIRYWMRAYGLLDEKEELTVFAKNLFSVRGYDPYLEDEGSLWLLHYQIISKGFASIYDIVFNDFRKQKPEFTKEHFLAYVKNQKINVNDATLSKDFDALMKTYLSKGKEAEDNYEGLLTDLGIIEEIKLEDKSGYLIRIDDRDRLPEDIVLYCILNLHKKISIDFDTLLLDKNSVGAVFAMTKNGLINKLEMIATKYKKEGVVLSNNSGVRELQFKRGLIEPKEILKNYYSSVYAS